MSLQVFLCHSSGDKEPVRKLYHELRTAGFRPWLDEEDLLPGHDWEYEIVAAIRRSDVVLACLSVASVSKSGFVQRELRFALDVADEQPEGAIFLIPVKLEPCETPVRLRRLHCVGLFETDGMEKLRRALDARALALGKPASERSGGPHGTVPPAPGTDPSAAVTKTFRCPNCKMPNDEDWWLCEYCGAELG